MSQAEDLLYSLKEAATAYDFESEPCIVIGEDRFITVPESLKRIAVQYDHNIQTVTFLSPRYWDSRDMSQMKIYINCMLPNGTTAQSLATNVTASGRVMSFDWTITNVLTKYKGNLSMLVCIKKTDSDGNEENHWNSELNRDLYVSEGLECTQTVVSKYPDIITQLLTRMDEVEAIATPEAMQGYTNTWLEENHATALAEIEAKGVETLASIPENYTAVSNMATEAVRTKADGIVCTATGETISVSDSSDDYIRGLKVFGKTTQVKTTGKNLLNCSAPSVTNEGNVKYTCEHDSHGSLLSLTVNGKGKGTGFTYLGYTATLPAGSYILTGCPAGGNPTTYSQLVANASDSSTIGFDVGDGFSFTLLEKTSITVYTGRVWSENTVNDLKFYPMIRLATNAVSSFEPYSAGFASPSPDWHQDLKNINEDGQLGLYINGYNLFNPHDAISIAPYTTISETGWVTVDIPANSGIQFSNLFTKSAESIVVGKKYVITCMVKEITNGSLHYLSNHTEPGGSSQFNRTYSANTEGVFKTIATVVYSHEESDYMLRSYFGLTDSTKAAKCVYRIWVYPVELGEVDYEPYVTGQSIRLPYALPGIPVSSGGNYTDANGQQWICDEIDFERGVYVQRIETVQVNENMVLKIDDVGKDTAQAVISGIYHKGCDSDRAALTLTDPILSNRYTFVQWLDNPWTVDNSISYNTYAEVRVKVPATETPESYKTFVKENDLYVSYVRKDPIETSLTADEITAYKALRSNYSNTTVLNDSGATMELKYNADTKIYVDNAIKAAVAEIVSSMS